jgi:HAD superfamily hydrolase (TIGR01459 family)
MSNEHFLPGLSAIADQYDVVLCDIWGVVHNGKAAYQRACDALVRFRQKGGTVVLVTNAPRPFPPILKQLELLKVPPQAFDRMVTSGDVTLRFVTERGNAPLYHIGPERDHAFFEILRDQTGLFPPRVDLEQADYVLCTGLFHDEYETPDHYAASFDVMLRRKLDFISANPDLIVHVGDKELYCAGALAHRYEQLGGRVFQAGKPFGPIYERALAIAEEVRGKPFDKKRVLAIGDALRTDIKGASDQGLDALFVTQGIHRAELHPSDTKELGPFAPAAYQKAITAAGLSPRAVMQELSW